MLEFRPWRRFTAFYNAGNVRRFLHDAAELAERTFRMGVINPPKSGVKYANLPNRSSIGRPEAEYPATQSGALAGSIKSDVTVNEMTVGSGAEYSVYLRNGTSKMRRRKMSDTALKESLPSARQRMRTFAEWRR